MIDYNEIAPSSKIWVYQSNRKFTNEEVSVLSERLEVFTNDWTAHKVALKSYAKVYYNTFIVLMVDESQTNTSGCSIDASTRFIQSIEKDLGVVLLDRFIVAYKQEDNIEICTKEQFQSLIEQGIITDKTIVFDNTVQTKEAFDKTWETTFENSWHNNVFSLA